MKRCSPIFIRHADSCPSGQQECHDVRVSHSRSDVKRCRSKDPLIGRVHHRWVALKEKSDSGHVPPVNRFMDFLRYQGAASNQCENRKSQSDGTQLGCNSCYGSAWCRSSRTIAEMRRFQHGRHTPIKPDQSQKSTRASPDARDVSGGHGEWRQIMSELEGGRRVSSRVGSSVASPTKGRRRLGERLRTGSGISGDGEQEQSRRSPHQSPGLRPPSPAGEGQWRWRRRSP